MSPGEAISPETGEHAGRFVLTNRSTRPCALDGYPRVALYDGRHKLAFVYRRGGGHYVSARRPQRVLLRPGSHAFFLEAKFRCDGGVIGAASEIRARVPDGAGFLRLRLAGRGVVGALDYCGSYSGGRHPDPGNTVEVSPLTASAGAVLPP
jgi:hypothetical protein